MIKINIFFFISNFKFGGAGNAVLNFLSNLNKNKFNIHIIYLGNSEYLKEIPNHINILQINNNFLFFKTFFSFFKIKKIIEDKTKGTKYNLFISNIHYSNILTIIFLRKLKNLKIFLFERTSLKELDIFFSFLSFFKNQIIKLLIRFFYKSADSVFSNSLTLKKEFDNLGIKSKVIYSGSLKKILPKKKFKRKNFYKLISVGRLTKQKNYTLLLNSIKFLKLKNFKLFIYGEGYQKNEIKKIILNNKLSRKVFLKFKIKNKDLIYKDADLLIHTALFEGLPNSIVDAINYGVPVIAYNGYGGISEILGNGKYGNIVKNHDPLEISQKIQNFFNNPKILQRKITKSKIKIHKFLDFRTTSILEKEIIKIF
tara:strand:+ start:648 stop:1754 length:1107 start_codon:yes stop_codon:yes gene_type:complete